MDPVVSSLAARLEPSTSKSRDDDAGSDVSDSDLLDALENEYDFEGMRERRIEELKKEWVLAARRNLITRVTPML